MTPIGKSEQTISEHLQDMLNDPELLGEMTGYQIIAVKKAIKLLAEDTNVPVKQPDPITGLVPCGCGGKAIMLCDLDYAVACEKCLIGLPYAFDTEELARQAWNRAIGFERIGVDWEETAI